MSTHTRIDSKADGRLYVVATPIGNLSDITLRALEVLRSVDVVAAEDTRVTQQLLQRHGVDARLVALHEHNEARAAQQLVERMVGGERIALVSDAGTPAVSDPGALLVRAARAAGVRVEPIPGANAAVAALSVAGLTDGRFRFAGFLPARGAARRKLLHDLRRDGAPIVFYEAPHRVLECAEDLCAVFGGDAEVFVARELTKTFESTAQLTLAELPGWLAGDPNRQRGEFVLIVTPVQAPEVLCEVSPREALVELMSALPLKQAVQLAARITGANRSELYTLALSLKAQTPAPEG